MKFKWFKFYFCYREIFEKIPVWGCRKLLLAIIDYADKGSTEIKLRGKSLRAFNRMKAVFEREKMISQALGREGAARRWKSGRQKTGSLSETDRGAVAKE